MIDPMASSAACYCWQKKPVFPLLLSKELGKTREHLCVGSLRFFEKIANVFSSDKCQKIDLINEIWYR